MTATGTRPLDALPPEAKAMLSLVLVQGRSFQEIADMLHMAPADVRARAHAAAVTLAGGSDERLSPAGRARIVDYLLGEQSVSERELTRSELMSLDASREWARKLSASLAMLAREPLPSIPEPVAEPGRRAGPVAAEPMPELVAAASAPEVVAAEPAPQPGVHSFAPPPVAPPPVAPPPVAPPPVDPPPVAPPPVFLTPAPAPPRDAPRRRTRGAPPPPPRERHRVPTGWLVAALVVLAGAFAAIIVLATNGGGSSSPARGLTSGVVSTPAAGHSSNAGAGPAKTVRRLVLTPTDSASKALGAGAVVSQHGKLLLLMQARGLQPNRHNSYGVWLYNAPDDAELLGFVPQAVGADGTFSSSVNLPDDAVRFHALIVTLETSQLPKKPGPTVLRGSLSLP